MYLKKATISVVLLNVCILISKISALVHNRIRAQAFLIIRAI